MVQGGQASAMGSWVGRGRMRIAIVTSVFCALAAGLYATGGMAPSSRAEVFLIFAPTLAVVLWVVQDARQRHIAQVHDFDWLVWTFWPLSIPWYCVKSRGARGLLLLAWLAGLILLPWITWLVITWIRFTSQ